MTRLARRLAPLVALTTGACFATREDVRVLQSDLLEVRAQSAQSDSALRERLGQVVATLGTVNDSVRVLGTRLTRMQGDLRGDVYALGQQLIQIQELTGQSQQRLQQLRASLEQRSQEAAAADSLAGGDTTAGTQGAAPRPNQLIQLSPDHLPPGSAGTARTGFE